MVDDEFYQRRFPSAKNSGGHGYCRAEICGRAEARPSKKIRRLKSALSFFVINYGLKFVAYFALTEACGAKVTNGTFRTLSDLRTHQFLAFCRQNFGFQKCAAQQVLRLTRKKNRGCTASVVPNFAEKIRQLKSALSFCVINYGLKSVA